MPLRIPLLCLAWLLSGGLCLAQEGETLQWPQPLHTLVVLRSGPEVPAVIQARTQRGLAEMLEANGAYRVLELEEATQRLSINPSTLFSHCEDRIRCWQQYAHQLGADLLVLGKINETNSGHQLRLWLVSSGRILTREAQQATLPAGGGVPFELVESVFFQPGSLRLELPPGNTLVAVDDSAQRETQGDTTRLTDLAPGRHKIHAGSETDSVVQVYPIFPGGESQHRMPGPRRPLEQTSQSRWGSVALCAILVSGVTVMALGRNSPGLATSP